MVAGFSVDYVLHIAHMYLEAGETGQPTREARVRFALAKMGATVAAGAVTTTGAGVILQLSRLTLFIKMGRMLVLTIVT